jgi:hypothetical protein
MTSNENLNSRDLRAQPQQGDTEIGGSSNSQTAQTAGQQNPTPAHNPSLLPESYLRANTLKPSHLGNRSSKDAEPNQEPGQSQQEGHGQSPGANPATDQAEEAGGKEARVPTLKRPEELPIDCTIQMRGRTLRNQDEQNQVPWEKS